MEVPHKAVLTRNRVPSQVKNRRVLWRRVQDQLAQWGIGALAWAIIGLLIIIGGVLLLRSWPILSTYSLNDILFSTTWQPMRGLFGMAPFIVGTIAVTIVAMVVAVPLAIFSGTYLAEYTSTRTRFIFKPITDLLAGVPPVVYGVWGVLVVVPLVRDYIGPWSNRTLGTFIPLFASKSSSGYGIMAAGLVLSLMIFPIIATITEEVLRTVPRELREALHALGATRWETTKVILLRSSLPGIVAAIVLGFSRAFGETLAVLMVVGNIPRVPNTVFDGAYTLAGLIANNYGEMMSVPLYEGALMSAALMLLVVVVCFNIGAWLFLTRTIRKGHLT